MLAHARSVGVPAVFRPVTFNGAVCRQALDAGAAGIQVSHVDTEAEAVAAVSACRYPPLGHREMSLGRAIGYDPSYIPGYVAQANDCQLLVLMIESLESVKNIDKIAAVPGIDVLEVGMADLAHAMGLSGQHHHPELYAAIDHILQVTKKHGVALGLPISDPQGAVEWAAKGVRYFEGDTPDYVLREVYAERLAALNEAFKEN